MNTFKYFPTIWFVLISLFLVLPTKDLHATCEITIHKRWNLISLPENNEKTAEDLFGHLIRGKIWLWDRLEYKSIDPATFLDPNSGYWIYSEISDVVPLGCPTIAEMATYQLTFEGTWSQATHPVGFPGGAHFTSLIGASHNEQIVFWEIDGLASLGIERVAEIGQTSTFTSEISTAQSNGFTQALPFNPVIQASGIGSTGTSSTTFSIHKDFSRVTLASMIAPSPDWFVGVNGLDLIDDDQWITNTMIELRGYDAGTEDGSNFSLSNPATTPQMPISILDQPPFKVNDEFVPVARVIFQRL